MKTFKVTTKTGYDFIEANEVQIENGILIFISNNRLVAAYTAWNKMKELEVNLEINPSQELK